MNHALLRRWVCVLLALAMLLCAIPMVFATQQTEQRKTLSILGDSISTFSNHSNGSAASTTNSTIAGGAIYYPRSGFAVSAASTWWYQAAEALGWDILVNNSWSGSCLLKERSGTVGAYVDRCVQLHDNTGSNAGQKPDVIAIFLGTNDYYTYPGTLGSFEAIDFGALIQSDTYAQPTTSMEAYAIILHKISKAYPEAQVYCFTLLPRVNSGSQPTAFNADICRLAEHFGVHTVDLYNCGISSDSQAFYRLMGDSLHPDDPGMDAITNAFVSAVRKNSSFATYDVTFQLEEVVAMEGTTRTVLSGEPFEATLSPLDASLPLEVSVTMNGTDITASCLTGNRISIPKVTGNVVITAKPGQREPLSFRWETQGDALVSVTTDGNTKNDLTMTHGTIADRVYSKTRFTMSQGIRLRHDLPWAVEWESSGTWADTTDGALLFAEANSSSAKDAYYFYRRHNNDFFAFGSYTAGNYHNYGVSFAGTGIDTTLNHTFRMENRIAADGSNMIYLYVDNVEVGPMNAHYVGGTDKKETSDWVSGKDFTFSYLGTTPHTIGGCSIGYIQVWENGKTHYHSYIATVTKPTYTEGGYTTYTCAGCGDSYVADRTDPIALHSYCWETRDDALVSVTTGSSTENALTMTAGSITGGLYQRTQFTLQNSIRLYHDQPWAVEWKSSGTWTDNTDGALLFAEANTSTAPDTCYFYRRHKNDFFAFGTRTAGNYHNYGVSFAGTGIDTTAEHTYRLENRIAADGSNMIYLYVDGVEVGPMNTYFIGGTNQGKTSDWVSGKDFTFSYLGTSPHTIGGCSLEYIRVWEMGHTHSYEGGLCAACGHRLYFPGDINGDNAVNFHDAVYLLLHTLFGADKYPLSTAPADVDGNGTAEQHDAVYLLLHTLFGDSFYPLAE